MPLATLSIDLEARLANLQGGFDRATRLAEKSAADIQDRFDRVNQAFGRLGVALGAAFAGTSFTAFVRTTAEGLDKLKDLSDATGSSVENLSALEDVAARTGTSFEDFASSIVKFNKVLAESKAGSADANIFRSLGLDLKELQALDPSEALRRTAVALSRFADDGAKARDVQQLFGKSVQQAAPFLKELAEQTELVAKVTTAQAAAGEQFNKNLLSLQKNSLDLARTLAGPLIDALNKVFAATEAYGSLFSAFKDNFRFDQSEGGPASLAKVFAEIEAAQKRLARISQVESRPGLNDALLNRYKAERAELEKQIELLRGRGRFIIGQTPQGPGSTDSQRRGLSGSSLGDITADTPKRALTEAERYLETLQKQGEKTRQLNTYEQALLDIQKGRLDGVTPKLKEQILAQAKLNDVLGKTLELESPLQSFRQAELKATEAVNKSLVDANAAATEAVQKRALQLFEETRTPQEKFNARMEELNRLLEQLGPAFEDTFNRAAGQASKDLDDSFSSQVKSLQKVKSLTEELGLTFSSAFEDAIVSGGNLQSVLKGLAQDILRISTRKFVTEPLGNAFTGLLQGFFGGGSAKGNAFDTSGQMRFRAGGVVDRPTNFRFARGIGLMGEDGPEAIMPLVRGKGGKLGVQASGRGGGIVIQQTNHFSGGVNRAELASFVAANNRRLVEGLQQSRNRDGGMA